MIPATPSIKAVILLKEAHARNVGVVRGDKKHCGYQRFTDASRSLRLGLVRRNRWFHHVPASSVVGRPFVLPARVEAQANIHVQQPRRNAMTDPRDIAHDKKVRQEKKKRGQMIAPGADKTPQLGKKTHKDHHASDTPKVPDEAAPVPNGEKQLD